MYNLRKGSIMVILKSINCKKKSEKGEEKKYNVKWIKLLTSYVKGNKGS